MDGLIHARKHARFSRKTCPVAVLIVVPRNIAAYVADAVLGSDWREETSSVCQVAVRSL